MKIVLAGTPEFSVEVFEEIINHFNVVAIISQPDKPANRGYKLIPTPVKLLAQKYNIKLFQPEKISNIYEELKEIDFDIFLTCAFGQYIPEKILNLPKIASINIHGSLLPKYRGAAPIQYSLLNNDKKTGINLIYMTKDMDAGDILASAQLEIDEYDTSDRLFVKMSKLATNHITKWLNNFEHLQKNAIKQDPTLVTLSPKLKKEEALIDHTKSVLENFGKIRAYSSNPGAYMFVDGKRVKIYYASKKHVKNAIIVPCCDGQLYAIDYQFESKKRVVIKPY
ncbi:methionyl-tRNA formyltransferase [Mycoplasmopsis ciconiae]|uniref:Methionyl-tRNA formyltransferase n=1 Tax=Mycoplasmopsis ciconiae TaxID=561067 RepID=A0ABU7MKQ0_9BACT|nr:methionyl-tRNA formyltransferase [Mycoplasmopsis ciconiae]